ncbi:hypothetical protein AAHE18_09G191100 [Arachis hypogaea]|nr:exonuclease V, chloroplastic [Arachis hypogaea]
MAGSPSKTPRFLLKRKTKSIDSDSAKAKRNLFTTPEPDIEDYGHFFASKNKKVADTFLEKYRSKRGLFVTDVSKTEWCQKQMEFSLFFDDEECNNNNNDDKECFSFVYEGRASGTGKNNTHDQAMKAGIDRHVELRDEVLKPVRVEVKSREDFMALKLVNFINGVNQLLFEGLTRELPIVSFAFEQGIWMVGSIDEVRMHSTDHKSILVETKTRISDTVPSESQKRNVTLNEVVVCYQTACKMMPRAHDDELVLRYESQRDKSLVLDEDKFAYNYGWLKSEISKCLQFWLQQREASFVAVEDQWKCAYCYFTSLCPAYPHDTTDDDDDE